MKKDVFTKKIETTNINIKIVKVLNDYNVQTVYDLWILSRKDLKKMGLNDSDIYMVIVQLQLMGLDLNKKIY